MMQSIIVALITGGFTLLGVIITTVSANSKTRYQIAQLEEKVDRHNTYDRRIVALETKIEMFERNENR